jgi:hypothetical protein
MTDRHRLSYSQASTYKSCGEKYRLQKRFRKHGPPSWANIGGTAAHQMTEKVDKINLGISVDDYPVDFEAAMDEAEAHELERWPGEYTRKDIKSWGRRSARWPEKENRDWWLENGPQMVEAWQQWTRLAGYDVYVAEDSARTGIDVVGIELEFELETSDVPVIGRVDRLMRDRATGQLLVVDLKFGSHEPETPEQLGTYRVGLLQEYGLNATAGLFWFGRSGGSSVLYDLRDFTEERLDYEYNVVETGIANNMFVPNPDRHCGYCDVRDWCRAVGGSKAHEIPLPWPTVTSATLSEDNQSADEEDQ